MRRPAMLLTSISRLGRIPPLLRKGGQEEDGADSLEKAQHLSNSGSNLFGSTSLLERKSTLNIRLDRLFTALEDAREPWVCAAVQGTLLQKEAQLFLSSAFISYDFQAELPFQWLRFCELKHYWRLILWEISRLSVTSKFPDRTMGRSELRLGFDVAPKATFQAYAMILLFH